MLLRVFFGFVTTKNVRLAGGGGGKHETHHSRFEAKRALLAASSTKVV